jgi:1-acyl-sn-glycerol-3-phosphate acyltransferase
MFYVRIALGLLAFVVASVYGVGIALFRRDRSRVAYDYATLLYRLQQPALGLRVRITGEAGLHAYRPCIFIGNHQSVLDVPILAQAFAPGSVVIAKKELRSIPFFGWIYTVTGNILIDRADNRSAVGRLKEVEEAILQRGAAVWIFPEGTRGREPGRMLPFKKGAFYMAVATGAPLVPVVVSPLAPRMSIPDRRLEPGDVEIRVLDPIPTAGLGEADVLPLMREARRRMAAALSDMAVARGLPPAPPEEEGAALEPSPLVALPVSGSELGHQPRTHVDASARDFCLSALAHLKFDFPDDQGPAHVLAEADSPVLRDIGHRLRVVYLVDEGDHFTYVLNRHLAAAGLTEHELHQQALLNLRSFAEQHVEVRPHDDMYAVLAGGGHEASMLLLDEFWSSWYGHLAPNGFVVAFPARDMLAFGDSASPEALADLRALCLRVQGRADHPLSPELYRRTGTAWEPLGS